MELNELELLNEIAINIYHIRLLLLIVAFSSVVRLCMAIGSRVKKHKK